jgi:hypothetical protein
MGYVEPRHPDQEHWRTTRQSGSRDVSNQAMQPSWLAPAIAQLRQTTCSTPTFVRALNGVRVILYEPLGVEARDFLFFFFCSLLAPDAEGLRDSSSCIAELPCPVFGSDELDCRMI